MEQEVKLLDFAKLLQELHYVVPAGTQREIFFLFSSPFAFCKIPPK